MNHALHPYTILTSPLYVRGKWLVGFLAATNIKAGDEVVWDYGVRGEEWAGSGLVDGVVRVAGCAATKTKVGT